MTLSPKEYTAEELRNSLRCLVPIIDDIQDNFQQQQICFKLQNTGANSFVAIQPIGKNVTIIINLDEIGFSNEIILAHEIIHGLAEIYKFPIFPRLYNTGSNVKITEVLGEIMSNSHSFCEHFFVNTKVKELYDIHEISDTWKDMRPELYYKGQINNKLTGYIKENRANSNGLIKYIRLNKALLAADMYFGLSDNDAETFIETFKSGPEDKETKDNFRYILSKVAEIGVSNLSHKDSTNNVSELHKIIQDMMNSYPDFYTQKN